MYPLMVNMTNKHCVIVGGGKVAARKAKNLLNEGANVTIVSPEICSELQLLENKERLTIVQRVVQDQDFTDAFFVIVATDDEDINHRIVQKLESQTLVNSVSSINEGNCHVPASLKQGKLHLSVYTSGASPYLAKKIKDSLTERYDENFGTYVDFLFEARETIKQLSISPLTKKRLLQELMNEKFEHSNDERKSFYTKLKSF